MLMNADEFDDDFGDPRSMRSGIAGLDLESSGEAKESKSLWTGRRGAATRARRRWPRPPWRRRP